MNQSHLALIRQAATALERGDKGRAQQLLAQVLRADAKNETAWLWMAAAVDLESRRIECLQRVLAINPDNPTARQMVSSQSQKMVAEPPTASQAHHPAERGPTLSNSESVSPVQENRSRRGTTSSIPPDGILACEKCGRQLGPRLVNCAERAKGECPYGLDRSSIVGSRGGGWLMLVIGLSAVPLGWIIEPVGGRLVAVGLGLLFVAVGLVLAFGERLLLLNETTGQMWEQTSVFGLALSQSVGSASEEVPFDIHPARPLTYPASVVALYRLAAHRPGSKKARIDDAADVFCSTLISLGSQELIALKTTWVSRGSRLISPERVLALQPIPAALERPADGELETRILQTIREWTSSRAPSFRVTTKTYNRKLRHCLTIDDLVTLVLDGEQANPGKWLISEIVGPDAARRGIGETKGVLIKRFELPDGQRDVLRADYQVLEQMGQQFAALRPTIMLELKKEVQKTMTARIDDD